MKMSLRCVLTEKDNCGTLAKDGRDFYVLEDPYLSATFIQRDSIELKTSDYPRRS